MADESNYGAIFLKSVQYNLRLFLVRLKGFSVFGKTFLFGFVPIFVESSLKLLAQVLRP